MAVQVEVLSLQNEDDTCASWARSRSRSRSRSGCVQVTSSEDDTAVDPDCFIESGISEFECGHGATRSVPPLSEDSLLIFDWDDTLLPSSWVQQHGLQVGGAEPSWAQWMELHALARGAAQLLQIAKRSGRVIVVTNAEQGWVELSCHKFLPELAPVLEGVNIISARTTFEPLGVKMASEWKRLAIQNEVDKFIRLSASDKSKDAISFGDSAHERAALFQAADRVPNCHAKSLKFMTRPDVKQLMSEHDVVCRHLQAILEHNGCLDLCFRCPSGTMPHASDTQWTLELDHLEGGPRWKKTAA